MLLIKNERTSTYHLSLVRTAIRSPVGLEISLHVAGVYRSTSKTYAAVSTASEGGGCCVRLSVMYAADLGALDVFPETLRQEPLSPHWTTTAELSSCFLVPSDLILLSFCFQIISCPNVSLALTGCLRRNQHLSPLSGSFAIGRKRSHLQIDGILNSPICMRDVSLASRKFDAYREIHLEPVTKCEDRYVQVSPPLAMLSKMRIWEPNIVSRHYSFRLRCFERHPAHEVLPHRESNNFVSLTTKATSKPPSRYTLGGAVIHSQNVGRSSLLVLRDEPLISLRYPTHTGSHSLTHSQFCATPHT